MVSCTLPNNGAGAASQLVAAFGMIGGAMELAAGVATQALGAYLTGTFG
jgi:hypothetical protein